MEQLAAGSAHHDRPTASTSSTSSARSATASTALVARAAAVFAKEVAPALDDAGIRFADWDEPRPTTTAPTSTSCSPSAIFPVLTPLAVDPAHPFPYISNLSLNLAVTVRDPSSGDERFARVKVPPLLPRFVALPDGERFVPLEQLIAAKLDSLFPGMEVLAHHPFRVTRDADFELEDEAEDLLEAIESVLRRRSKFGRVVRLEVDTTMTDEVLELLCRELELSDADVNVIDGPLDLGGLWSLYALDRPELKDEPWVPQTPAVLAGTDRRARLLPPAAQRRRARAPPVRLVRDVGRAVRRAGRRRSARARDQADDLPHRRRRERDRALARSRPPSRASRSSRSSSSRPASTSRPTSHVPACSKKRACTSCTASSG